jgi:hypothetical protein
MIAGQDQRVTVQSIEKFDAERASARPAPAWFHDIFIRSLLKTLALKKTFVEGAAGAPRLFGIAAISFCAS